MNRQITFKIFLIFFRFRFWLKAASCNPHSTFTRKLTDNMILAACKIEIF